MITTNLVWMSFNTNLNLLTYIIKESTILNGFYGYKLNTLYK